MHAELPALPSAHSLQPSVFHWRGAADGAAETPSPSLRFSAASVDVAPRVAVAVDGATRRFPKIDTAMRIVGMRMQVDERVVVVVVGRIGLNI